MGESYYNAKGQKEVKSYPDEPDSGGSMGSAENAAQTVNAAEHSSNRHKLGVVAPHRERQRQCVKSKCCDGDKVMQRKGAQGSHKPTVRIITTLGKSARRCETQMGAKFSVQRSQRSSRKDGKRLETKIRNATSSWRSRTRRGTCGS